MDLGDQMLNFNMWNAALFTYVVGLKKFIKVAAFTAKMKYFMEW